MSQAAQIRDAANAALDRLFNAIVAGDTICDPGAVDSALALIGIGNADTAAAACRSAVANAEGYYYSSTVDATMIALDSGISTPQVLAQGLKVIETANKLAAALADFGALVPEAGGVVVIEDTVAETADEAAVVGGIGGTALLLLAALVALR